MDRNDTERIGRDGTVQADMQDVLVQKIVPSSAFHPPFS
jgi:hypothetical protein